ncbi:MAG: LPS export ABC transporter periplasmic protein LptC [Blastocatellia bacterium]
MEIKINRQFWFQRGVRYTGRILSLLVMLALAAAIIVSFLRNRKNVFTPPPPTSISDPGRNIVAITEGYEYISRENGRMALKLTARRDITYDDGRHELENLRLVTYVKGIPQEKEEASITANRGEYRQQAGLVIFAGNVIAKRNDGLEVHSEAVHFDQGSEIATSDVAVAFKYKQINGTSLGAVVDGKHKNIMLRKDAWLLYTPVKKTGRELPIEMRGQNARFSQMEGVAQVNGSATVTQGTQSGQADTINAIFTKGAAPKPASAGNEPELKVERLEARGKSVLKTMEPGKAAQLTAPNIDFHLDAEERLKQAVAWGGAHAQSLEKDTPRDVTSERIDAQYVPVASGSELSVINTQGRTTLKISSADKPGVPEQAPDKGAPTAGAATTFSERILEADAVQVNFREGGRLMSRTEARGNSVLTVIPSPLESKPERKTIRAPKLTADFADTANLIRQAVAEGGATVTIDPVAAPENAGENSGKPRAKKTLTGKKMTADFVEQTQDIKTIFVDQDAKFTEADRQATATTALYDAGPRTVAMRGAPQVWDTTLRVNADEIDAEMDSGVSVARGKVRTTYFSREKTNGAAPFKKMKSPVFIASDKATLRHGEGAARYEGNARAWQDENFVRGQTIDLDRNEKTMIAQGAVSSALYTIEREVEAESGAQPPRAGTAATPASTPAIVRPPTDALEGKAKPGRKEVIPVFATADRMDYSDVTRVIRYQGNTILRQGSDRIDAARADIQLDAENRMEKMTAETNVVLTQPARRGTGDAFEYVTATDVAVLTGNAARIEDRDREAVTTGPKLTLHMRDARIQASENGVPGRITTTHRIRQK